MREGPSSSTRARLLALLLPAWLLDGGCTRDAPPEPRARVTMEAIDPPAAAPSEPETAARPSVPELGPPPAVDWRFADLDAALEEAARAGKLVLVDFGAYWCTACHELDVEVFARPEVGAFVRERFVAVQLDAEKGEGPELVERYGISSYPTLLVLEAGGVERGRITDAAPWPQLQVALEQIAAREGALASLEEAAGALPPDLPALARLAFAYARTGRAVEALRIYTRILEAAPEGRLAERVRYERAAFAQAAAGARDDALAALVGLREASTRAQPAIWAARRELALRAEGARAILDALVAAAPRDRDRLATRGEYCVEVEGAPACAALIEQAIEQHPRAAELHHALAEVTRRGGDSARALAAAEDALRLEPLSQRYQALVRELRGADGGPA